MLVRLMAVVVASLLQISDRLLMLNVLVVLARLTVLMVPMVLAVLVLMVLLVALVLLVVLAVQLVLVVLAVQLVLVVLVLLMVRFFHHRRLVETLVFARCFLLCSPLLLQLLRLDVLFPLLWFHCLFPSLKNQPRRIVLIAGLS